MVRVINISYDDIFIKFIYIYIKFIKSVLCDIYKT